jgi:phospholipase C
MTAAPTPSDPVGGDQPSSGATSSSVKHVIVVVMQNHSFNNLFGKFSGVDGIQPGTPGYSQVDANGNTVTPTLLTNPTVPDLPHDRQDYLTAWNKGAMNQYAKNNGDLSMGYFDDTITGVGMLWNWAKQYALADKYFASVMSNAPANPLYLVAASDNNFPFSFQPAFGPCNTPDPAAVPLTFPNIGDQLTQAGIGWGWFQENYGQCGNGYIQQENPFQYFTSTHDSPNLQDLSAFFTKLDAGTLPAVSFVQPGPTHSGHPGSGSLDNALKWLDGFITRIQGSSAWNDAAIFVIFDESGGWWDHEPPPQIDSQGLGARVPLLVISPFAKKGYVSHVQMDHVSILKFIQWNWKLSSLNARNDASGDIRDMFNF